jgi:hypothetical protein
MTSERQRAANARNARKSKGPQSLAGKRRAAKNAFKYGLAVSTAARAHDPLLDKRAIEIAGRLDHPAIRKCAREIAEAELDRVDRVRVGLVEGADRDYGQKKKGAVGEGSNASGVTSADTQQDSPTQIDQIAEATRRVFPELMSTVRYERRAIARRDKAVRRLVQLRRELASEEPTE